jgi:hypothetical protein
MATDAGRLTAIPGNHDRFPRGARRLFEEHFPEQARSDLPGPLRVRLLEGAALIAVETATVPSWPIVARGRATEALRALPAVLAHPEVRSRCALVMVHHAPLMPSGLPDWPWHGLRDGGELMRVCAEGGVQAVLCGHIHERYELPAGPGQPRLICAGSSTERGAEGYWLISIEDRRILSLEPRRIGG